MRRLTAAWQEEHARWRKRGLSVRRYVYLWADGVCFTPRLDHERQCLLILIGAQGKRMRSAGSARGRHKRYDGSRTASGYALKVGKLARISPIAVGFLPLA